MSTPDFYEFGPFHLNPKERLVLRDGKPLPLTPKAFDTLLVLVEHRGHLVERKELMQSVWPESYVEEGNLSFNISMLRKALGDGSGQEVYIETVPRRGYRFVAEVREGNDENVAEIVREQISASVMLEDEVESIGGQDEGQVVPLADNVPQSQSRKWLSLPVIVGAILVGLSIAVFALWTAGKFKSTSSGVAIKSLAVLPFKSIGVAEGDEYLGLGMADALITRLGNIRQITVRPTSVVRKFAAAETDPVAVGRELKVEAVLEGGVQRLGDRVRITVQLVSVQSGAPLWAEKFDERLTDFFSVEDMISDRVAGALALKLTGAERQQLARHDTENPEAHQLYLKGRYFWNRRTAEGLRKGMDCFRQAIEKDPRYSRAYVGLADCHLVLGDYGVIRPKEGLLEGKLAVTKAVELDDTLAEAHASLGLFKHHHDFDWAGAEKEFQRAIELNPSYPTAHHWYALLLTHLARFDEAFAEIRRAQELDPISVAISATIGSIHCAARQDDQAIKVFQQALELDPNFYRIHQLLGGVYIEKRRYQEAISNLQKARERDDRLEILAWLGIAYAASGQTDQARQILAELQQHSNQSYSVPYDIALIYTKLGEKNEAFAWLEKAYEERSSAIALLKVDPRIDSLRSDPRFRDLLRRVGLTT